MDRQIAIAPSALAKPLAIIGTLPPVVVGAIVAVQYPLIAPANLLLAAGGAILLGSICVGIALVFFFIDARDEAAVHVEVIAFRQETEAGLRESGELMVMFGNERSVKKRPIQL